MHVNGIILPTKIFLFSDWPTFLIYLKTQLLREVENKRMSEDLSRKHRQRERKEHAFVAEDIKCRQGGGHRGHAVVKGLHLQAQTTVTNIVRQLSSHQPP